MGTSADIFESKTFLYLRFTDESIKQFTRYEDFRSKKASFYKFCITYNNSIAIRFAFCQYWRIFAHI